MIGAESEIVFWDQFLRDQPPSYPDFADWRLTDVGNRECEWGEALLSVDWTPPSGTGLRALDVGSGPLLRWGDRLCDEAINWTCTDPLEDTYAALRAKHGRASRGAHVALAAGELSGKYVPDAFDFAVCSNSLDHSGDPVGCIEGVLAVTRGPVIVTGFVNEGSQAQGEGLHRWDMTALGGQLAVKAWSAGAYRMLPRIGERVVTAKLIDGRRPSFLAIVHPKNPG